MKFSFWAKTKLEYQVDEYIKWKEKQSVFSAEEHGNILNTFIKRYKYNSLREITLAGIQSFHEDNLEMRTQYAAIQAMKAVRGLMTYYWKRKEHEIDPRQITDEGVRLLAVKEIVSLPTMTKRKVGRPANIALIQKVKKLKDDTGLSFRAIGRAIGKDVSQVYVWYKFDISDKVLSE